MPRVGEVRTGNNVTSLPLVYTLYRQSILTILTIPLQALLAPSASFVFISRHLLAVSLAHVHFGRRWSIAQVDHLLYSRWLYLMWLCSLWLYSLWLYSLWLYSLWLYLL